MAKTDENTGFACAHCGVAVLPLSNGSYRNHCPACLWSVHLDDVKPGDRASNCGALMAPVELRQKRKGWQVVHRCIGCGKVQPNKVATGSVQADEFEALLGLLRGISR